MAEAKQYRNFINGEWVTSASDRAFDNRNPADTSEIIGHFQDSTAEDVGAAVAAAREALRKWRLTPAPRRAEYLFKVGEILSRRKEEYAREVTRETGKILKEAREEIQESIDTAYHVAGAGRRLFGQTVPSQSPARAAWSVRVPVGLCGLITPWCAPMSAPSRKLMPALICGDTVVIKPASPAPLSAYHLVKVCQEAGVPRGVVNLVTGSGESAGSPLLEHPGVDLVSFTGSTEVGGAIGATIARGFKRGNLELSGRSVVIVLDDARVELALDGVIEGGFALAGQRPAAAGRVVVHKKVYPQFVEQLVERVKDLKIGDGLDETMAMGPVIDETAVKRIGEFVQSGRDEGAHLLCGGLRLTKGELGRGTFFAPTVFSEVEPKMRIAQEEILGPVLSVIPCDSLDQAVEIANGSRFGLAAAVYTQDVSRAFVALRDLQAGVVHLNASTLGTEVQLPCGGTRQSGNGRREAGDAALDIFSEWKTIYVDFSGKPVRTPLDA